MNKTLKDRDYIVSAEEKGNTEGKAKDKAERNIEIAKKMLTKKRPMEEISEFTELFIEKIKKLKIEVENSKK